MVGLLVHNKFNNVYIAVNKNCTALIIGFSNTNYIVNEGDHSVTLMVGVRGGTNRCNKIEWMLYYIIRNISAQCEQLLHEPIQHSIIFIINVCFSS